MKKALFFGSYDPLHIGHMAIANYVLEFSDVDSLILVLTPLNPLKQSNHNSPKEKLKTIKASLKKSNLNILVSDIEFNMQPPYYTINTLEEFKKIEPGTDFVLIIGADNLAIIEKWHRYKDILSNYEVWVYPRTGHDLNELAKKYSIKTLNAPIIEISSTMIREAEAMGKNMSAFKF